MAEARKKKNPLFGAAVLKLKFVLESDEQSPQFRQIYEGVLRDLGVTEAEVDAYLEANYAQVEHAVKAGPGRRGSS